MKINRFEELIAWQKAQDLAVVIYQLTDSMNDYGFKSQYQRAVVSISNNIAEGFDRKSKKTISPVFILRFRFMQRSCINDLSGQTYKSYSGGRC